MIPEDTILIVVSTIIGAQNYAGPDGTLHSCLYPLDYSLALAGPDHVYKTGNEVIFWRSHIKDEKKERIGQCHTAPGKVMSDPSSG